MGFQSFARIGKAFDEGKFHYQYVTKTSTPAPAATRLFVDMNQTSGQPKYNAFAGSSLTFTPLVGAGNDGIYTGPFIPGSTKHLVRWSSTNISTTTSAPPDYVYLCDYLGFYPLIDCDNVDLQEMDNTVTLPRYADGEGVRIVLITQAPITSSAPITINYINTQNNARSATFSIVAGAAIGVCVASTGSVADADEANPFFPLAGGCTGVKSITSVQFSASAGGFICAALVRPLATLMHFESGITTEKYFGFDTQSLPEIKQGAYLNYLINKSTQSASSIRSELVFINT